MNSRENRTQGNRTRRRSAGRRRIKGGQSGNRRGILLYGLGALGLVMLITAAFFGPQIVFAVQDDIRCGRTVSLSPLEVDVTSFNTNYEMDLYKRLERFAEGLAEDRQYYVTVQDMELTAEVPDWMASEQGISQSRFQELIWTFELIPEELFDYNLLGWKRCVIYGDDFAGGVNFILWYIELGYSEEGNGDQTVARLLVDGETGELYGIRTNFDSFFRDEEKGEALSSATLADFYHADSDNMLGEYIFYLGDYYGGLNLLDMRSWLVSMGYGYYPEGNTLYLDVPDETVREFWQYIQEENAMEVDGASNLKWMSRYSEEEIRNCFDRLRWTVREEGNCLGFSFPYGDNSLNLLIRLEGKIRYFKKKTLLMNITFGFPEIYERIPAFMADWN